MKNYLTLAILFFFSFTLTAQNQEFKIQKGGYIFEELGGYGLPSFFTVGYEKVNPISECGFLSTKIGVNAGVGVTDYNFGIPHGISMNFGKKHVFLETGLNGWFGYYYEDEDLANPNSNYLYLVGANVGVNTAFRFLKSDMMFRAYLNPTYNFNDELIRNFFVFGGVGMSFRIHQ